MSHQRQAAPSAYRGSYYMQPETQQTFAYRRRPSIQVVTDVEPQILTRTPSYAHHETPVFSQHWSSKRQSHSGGSKSRRGSVVVIPKAPSPPPASSTRTPSPASHTSLPRRASFARERPANVVTRTPSDLTPSATNNRQLIHVPIIHNEQDTQEELARFYRHQIDYHMRKHSHDPQSLALIPTKDHQQDVARYEDGVYIIERNPNGVSVPRRSKSEKKSKPHPLESKVVERGQYVYVRDSAGTWARIKKTSRA